MRKFAYALTGLLLGLKDASIRLQWFLAVVAIIFFWKLNITMIEWCILILCCGAVVVSEYFNTVVERMLDFQHNYQHPKIQNIKDLSAGAVLVSAIMALVVGLIIMSNHITI